MHDVLLGPASDSDSDSSNVSSDSVSDSASWQQNHY